MATKSTKKSPKPETVVPAVEVKATPAMDALKAAISDKPSASSVPGSFVTTSDPAISGAVRKGKSGVVKLGADPKVLKDAAEAAGYFSEISKLSALFAVKQATLRDYGAEKRKAFNKLFKTDATTVEVPYTVGVPVDQNSQTPGRETRYVQICCTNRYSVAKEPILAGRTTVLGEWFGKLFNLEKTKTLRPNAEELFRNILTENGILGENLDKAMELLFEETETVKTVDAYEALEQEAPKEVRAFLAQSVARQNPSIKFPQEG